MDKAKNRLVNKYPRLTVPEITKDQPIRKLAFYMTVSNKCIMLKT